MRLEYLSAGGSQVQPGDVGNKFPATVMKNKLQYAYSITVFLGVLISAYLMMNTDGNTQLPLRAFQSATYRTEALVVDPAVNQLFEMEGALSALPKTNSETKRTPSKVSNSD